MSSYFSVQFLLFNLQFGFWYAYNSYLTMNWEHQLQHLFIENCQVQTYIIITLLFVGEEFFPFCCHYKIGFTFPWTKTFLQVKSKSKFSLVHYFWSLASKVFLFVVMATCLLLYYSILLNLAPAQTMAVPLFPFWLYLLWIYCSFLFGNLSNIWWEL